MSIKAQLARQAVKTTARHTAHGTASKLARRPFRSLTLLALGAAAGGVVGWLIGRAGGDRDDAAFAVPTADPTDNGVPGRPEPAGPRDGAPVEDEALVEEEEDAAAAEAAAIGGRREPDADDPADQPRVESGGGEAEGFELAERDLAEIAAHGDQHRFPQGMAAPEEPQDRAAYGEPDEPIPSDQND